MADIIPTPPTVNSSPEFMDMDAQSVKWKERNDRQLRLWGVHGQEQIDRANVCLLNASSVGAETLKNLVLPGFGKFTIVDAHRVTEADLGNNFFVTKESIGESKAKIVTECLVELNPDNVVGQFLEEDPRTVIEKNPNFFDSYGYIIATQLDMTTVRQLAKLCWAKDKVLLIVRSYGLSGYVRIVTKSVEVIEAKLDNEIEDLRLTEPWYELQNFCNAQDYSKMTREQFFDTPFPVILIKAAQQWRTSHQGALPQSRAEREQFKQQQLIDVSHQLPLPSPLATSHEISDKLPSPRNSHEVSDKLPSPRNLHEVSDKLPSPRNMHETSNQLPSPRNLLETSNSGNQLPSRNFQEAIDKSHQACMAPEIPVHVERVLNSPLIQQLNKDSTDFWFLAKALKLFVENEGHGRLPVSAKLPDMEADTERYIQLQSLYRRKFRIDTAHVRKYVQQQLVQCGRNKDSIPESVVVDFCKNAYYIHSFTYRSLEQELNCATYNLEEMESKMAEYPSVMPLYLCYLASERFHATRHHYPGQHVQSDLNAESHQLQQILRELLSEYKLVESTSFDLHAYATEWTRWGAAELHNISALVGGVAAQELIKLSTKQRLPIQNTWLFNGIHSTSCAFNA